MGTHNVVHRVSDDFLQRADHFKLVIGVIRKLIRISSLKHWNEVEVFPLVKFNPHTVVKSYWFKDRRVLDAFYEYLQKLEVIVDQKNRVPDTFSFRVCLRLPLGIVEEHLPRLAEEARRDVDKSLFSVGSKVELQQGKPTVLEPARHEPVKQLVTKVAVAQLPVSKPVSPRVEVVPPPTPPNVQERTTPTREAVFSALLASKIPHRPYPGRPPEGVVSSVVIPNARCTEARRLFSDRRWQYKEADAKNDSSQRVFRFIEGAWVNPPKPKPQPPAPEKPKELPVATSTPKMSSTGVAKKLLADLALAGFILVRPTDAFSLVRSEGGDGDEIVTLKRVRPDDVLGIIRESLRSHEE